MLRAPACGRVVSTTVAITIAATWAGCSSDDALPPAGSRSGDDAGAMDGAPSDLDGSADGIGDPATLDGSHPADGAAPPPPPRLLDLWTGKAHVVPDQHPAPVPGATGHREAFAVERTDLSADTLFLYHRCFSYPGGTLSVDICLDESSDGGKTFPVSHGIVIHNSHGAFAVAPSVAKIGTTWTMVWEEGGTADGTYWATSPDGITWTNRGSLFGGTVYNATPSLYEFQGVVYVFSAQFVGPKSLGIFFHSGPSMAALVEYGGGAVLTGSASWNAGSVSMPRVVYQDGYHWMIFEGATLNLDCGGTSAEQNDYGWGIARSTTLTSWEPYDGNPINEGDDAETCGLDMPQPLLRANGSFFVFHTSDDAVTVQRDTLAFGRACGPTQTAPDWREKNYACMPSCGGAGGASCYQTKDCTTGAPVTPDPAWPGMTFDCVSCCK